MTRNILLDHYYRYPLMRTEDFFKLLYQGEFGAAHACGSSVDQTSKNIFDEAKSSEFSGQPLTEIISGSQARVNLAPFLRKGMSFLTLTEIFLTSGKTSRGSEENFKKKLDVFQQLVMEKKIGLPYLSTRSAVIKYLTDIRHPRHSVTYKLNYFPHYRVVRRDYFDLFEVIDRINSLLHKDVLLVAVEGNSGSGKSYYAKVLAEYYSPRCNVFHTDDFFLPAAMRTQARLAETGGNVHYERLQKLVEDIKTLKPLKYQKYNCMSDSFEDASAPLRQINIVEGVYSTHPSLIGGYDVILRLSIDPSTQESRLLARSGIEMLARYDKVWLPLENKFLKAPTPNAIVLETDKNDIYSEEKLD